MPFPKLTKLELRIMDALWNNGCSPFERFRRRFPSADRPAYTTIQTTVYRLEDKGAVRRAKKISNAHIFEAVVSREAARGRLIDELLRLFGGRAQPRDGAPGRVREAHHGRCSGRREAAQDWRKRTEEKGAVT